MDDGSPDVLVLQHHPDEGPGELGHLLEVAGARLFPIELDAGEAIPPLDRFDAMVAMGGPMDVWQESEYPWLREEKAAIAHFVGELGRPFFGVCLGHQLLAEATGGAVRAMEEPEIGVADIALNRNARSDEVFSRLPDIVPGLQWHHAEVSRLPPQGSLLASSEACAVQALRVGPCAWGVQFHVEVEPSTVDKWAEVPEYREVLTHGGHDDPRWLHEAVVAHFHAMTEATMTLAGGFLRSLDVAVPS
jgi:GMP synthase-like glutamine amidotransferase